MTCALGRQRRQVLCGHASKPVWGKTIAVRNNDTLSYLLSDQLGSTVGLMDTSGAVIGTAHYWPYGAQRSATGVLAGTATGTDKRYTGQQQQAADAAFGDTTLGLYNYNARFYSTTLGRFVSADTVTDGLDRYEHVHDNPVRYNDPSGHCFTLPNGQKQSCSESDALRWFDCAMGIRCSGAVRWMAEVAMDGMQYWGSVKRLDANVGGAVNAKLLTHFASQARSDSSLWSSMPDTAWHYFGDAVHVSRNYFRASFYSLVTDDTSAIDDLSPADVMGARPWWTWGTGLGGGGNGVQDGDAFRSSFTGLAKEETLQSSKRRTLDVAQDIGGPGVVDTTRLGWSPDQVGWLERSPHSGYQDIPYPYDPADDYDYDSSCYFIGICPQEPAAGIPDINTY